MHIPYIICVKKVDFLKFTTGYNPLSEGVTGENSRPSVDRSIHMNLRELWVQQNNLLCPIIQSLLYNISFTTDSTTVLLKAEMCRLLCIGINEGFETNSLDY